MQGTSVPVIGLFALPFPREVVGRVVIISVLVILLFLSEMRTVQLTSAMLIGILLPMLNIFTILVGVVLKGDRVQFLNWVGIMLCSVGTGIFKFARNPIFHAWAKKKLRGGV